MTWRTLIVLPALLILLSGCDLYALMETVTFQSAPEDPAPATEEAPEAEAKPAPPAIAAQPTEEVEVESLPPLGSEPAMQAAEPEARPVTAQPASLQVAGRAAGDSPTARPTMARPITERSVTGRYTVVKGDSLYGIARRFGLPVRAIIDANDLQPPYRLSLGQSLTIPQAQLHVVAVGDTVFSIAHRYGVDRSDLVRLNGIEPPYAIPVGRRLILPQPGTGASVAQVAAVPRSHVQAERRTAEGPSTAKPVLKPRVAAPQTTAVRAVTPRAKPVVAKRGPIGEPPPRSKSTFLWPVQGPVLSSYGGKESGVHNDGINIAAPRGTPVRAAENGVIVYAGEELKGFGKLLLIKHSDGWVTAYAHNQKLLVEQGDIVKRGQSVAKVGSTGSVTRPQLHFEVRRGTRAINPVTMMSPRQSAAARP